MPAANLVRGRYFSHVFHPPIATCLPPAFGLLRSDNHTHVDRGIKRRAHAQTRLSLS